MRGRSSGLRATSRVARNMMLASLAMRPSSSENPALDPSLHTLESAARATADRAVLSDPGDAPTARTVELHGLPPAATGAMARRARAETSILRDSRVLTGLMLALGINLLAWSMPAPSPFALAFALLCFALALAEHRRARVGFRRGVALAGEEHGIETKQSARAAGAIEQEACTEMDRSWKELRR
jgi:hypothetical protein